MVSNQSTLADESGEYDPWIEIHNATFSEVDLEGLALTGDPEDESKWVFGPGLRVPPKGYLIVWADGQPEQGPLHTGFQLGPAGSWIGFYDHGPYVWRPSQSLNLTPQDPDVSEGRLPDAAGDFTSLSTPTPAAPNDPARGGENAARYGWLFE